MRLTYNSIREFVATVEDKKFKTMTYNREFSVALADNGLLYIPSRSKIQRKQSGARIELFLQHYNKTQSMTPITYREISKNASYLLTLISAMINLDKEPRYSEEFDFEGMKVEATRFTSRRSRRLRDLALSQSNGICSVCGFDFKTLLDGRGTRVLQVHHRNQLSMRKTSALTKLSDLAVVCANCHMLLHPTPHCCLAVEDLQKILNR